MLQKYLKIIQVYKKVLPKVLQKYLKIIQAYKKVLLKVLPKARHYLSQKYFYKKITHSKNILFFKRILII